MLRRLIMIAVTICSLAAAADAAERKVIDPNAGGTKQVAILPFEIYSPEKGEYLQNKIPEVIKNHLKLEGAVVVNPEIPSAGFRIPALKEIRKIGIRSGADYVIWGSLTRIGQKFSLDAKMADTLGEDTPSAFFVEGESIENLPVTVKELARNFGMRIFKQERIAKVVVSGNQRIEADAVKRVIKTAPGDVFVPKKLSEDLKAVHDMGYFDDIRIEAEETPQGKIIYFNVVEKPTIRTISVINNKIYEDKEITDALDLKTGSILNIFQIQNNIKRIESLYKEKNYHNVIITHNIKPLENNQADLEFLINEGEKVRIKEISFSGNSAYSNVELKKLMKTSEKGFWSWLTSSGEFNKDDLDQDAAKISSFYHNNGYIQARVGEPQVEYKDNEIHISLKIDEGAQFKVGKVEVDGDIIRTRQELIGQLKIGKEKVYNEEVVRNDVLALMDVYSDEGYAYADISPRMDKDIEHGIVNISYTIEKGKQVYFEKIFITGNTKTRDKVIRRQLEVYERELYSGQRLKRSVRNLHRLDYFEDIKVNTLKGSGDDQMVLKLDVTEKPTGTFSFGGGYSSVENVFGMVSVSQRNLFGLGQTLQLKAEVGGSTTRYTLSFTEPWLFDIPLSAGFDLYNWEKDYDIYDKDSKGGGVRFGYPVYDYTRAYLSYSYDIADIENIDKENASYSIIEMEGENITSSIAATLQYDSRDKVFNPTEGANHSLTVEYAGIGGDIAFTKYLGELGQYIPLFWGTVGFLHAKGGRVEQNTGGKLPDYEKFYLGGMNSLRGFDWRDICLKEDKLNEDGTTTVVDVGGYQFVQFNAEFLIPLIKKAGIVGVLFYDTGTVYDKSEIDLGDMRKSAGFGFRWYSPMGPIRIENGYILDPKEGEEKGGRWEFTMGSAF